MFELLDKFKYGYISGDCLYLSENPYAFFGVMVTRNMTSNGIFLACYSSNNHSTEPSENFVDFFSKLFTCHGTLHE